MIRYSVIIATHNRPAWLARALRSVKAQSFEAVSVIVVADVDCAGTASVVASLLGPDDLYVRRWGAPGPAESRNIGIQLVASDFAIFLDDDDELPPDFIRAVDDGRPLHHRGALYADFTIVQHGSDDGVAKRESYSLATNNLDTIHIKNFIPNSCLIFPTKPLKSRRFDPDLRLNEDWDFILNAMTGTSLAHVPVAGPIIHKTEAPRRGNSNGHLLLESYMAIYQKWPAPTKSLKMARQSLLAQAGISLPLSKL